MRPVQRFSYVTLPGSYNQCRPRRDLYNIRMTLEEAAGVLGVSPKTIYKHKGMLERDLGIYLKGDGKGNY